MRVLAVALACVGVVAVSACSDTNKLYFREGVGSSLYSYTDSVSTPSQLQDLYVDEICKQAGFPSGFCIENSDPRLWRVFVEAGMNDIDQRCDAYLLWLDNIRRGKAPLIKQVSDIGTATTVIMTATGVGTTPIAVAAAAFGLATNTINNVTSRLVLEVDHSTVQAVVLGHQKEYREQLFGTAGKPGVQINSRPAAIYALRSYLRLCMPMTIEMQINGIVASVSAGGVPALTARKPVISAKTVGVTGPVVIRDVNAPLRPFIRPPVADVDTRIGLFEKRMSNKDMKRALDIVGCSGDDFGLAGSAKRKALSKFFSDNGLPAAETLTNDGFFSLRELKANGKQGKCAS